MPDDPTCGRCKRPAPDGLNFGICWICCIQELPALRAELSVVRVSLTTLEAEVDEALSKLDAAKASERGLGKQVDKLGTERDEAIAATGADAVLMRTRLGVLLLERDQARGEASKWRGRLIERQGPARNDWEYELLPWIGARVGDEGEPEAGPGREERRR